MALCNLIGCRQLHDLIDAVPKLAEGGAPVNFCVIVLIETNVNISNELNFSDVY